MPVRFRLGLTTVLVLLVGASAFYFRTRPLGRAALGAVLARTGALHLAPGFSVALFTSSVPGARSMALGSAGTVFVGTRSDRVYAVIDSDHDGKADRAVVIAKGLNTPNGVAVRNGALYVAEISRILRYDDIEAHLDAPPAPVVVFDGFPSDGQHGWKVLRFGPDGKLYAPVGAPCNVCIPKSPLSAAMHRLNVDGTGFERFANGIRNTVGFDWHPETGELWFTDNGRDWMGDDAPPDELNRAPRAGMNFGFPFCEGGDLKDPDFGDQHPCSDFEAPAQQLGAHIAALGMRFYTGKMFPPEYKNRIFIAEHGSWNRSTPVGYRVTMVTLEGNRAVRYEPFMEGFLVGGEPWGRPVDVQVMPDGALLVSDDLGGSIYRVTYKPR
ncbi:MAG: PQQ-dependent sugar dehydrogenase [Acidobacteriota bacterium]